MALACQKDSYLRELHTEVVSCEAASVKLNGNKKEKIDGYEIILEDTVLFPEGGGQPDDRGTLNGIEVLQVSRRGKDAVHFCTTPLSVGENVSVTVDWTRRFDHMQQHSGQHLVTAIADSMFGYKTTSWNLGANTSFIELDTVSMKDTEMQRLEEVVNEKIRQSVEMFPQLFDSKDDPALNEVRTRGLPDDHCGPVRVVTIQGIETNMCCGTHVRNLSHLQAIKLLAFEKGKKGKTNLTFVAGDRVLQYLGKSYEIEKKLTSLLKGPAEQFIELVDKVQKSYRAANKNVTILLRELAQAEVERFKNQTPKPLYLRIHRKEGDNEFMNTVANGINDKNVFKFLTTGDEKGQGMFLIDGPVEHVSELAPRIAELLDGKGAGKNGRFQGKANKLSKSIEAEKLVTELLQSKTSVDVQ
ncbi:alanyl-tRNA editing protein Aarsd1-A-like [Tubulanus polymorphus]|uniref:alanyl-tRNA editing protein Aarsd1-A-like n=1 Tax=Tubulanus polymorphus TaxID=672921 RepID=UPI003DA6BA1A